LHEISLKRSVYMKRKLLSKLIALGLFASLTFLPLQQINSFQNNPLSSTVYAATNYGLPANTKDGLILHAFNWSFNTIKSNLEQIAAAGYKSIQVSPVQGTKDPTTDASKWWMLYQPTNQSVGNAQLGSLGDFTSLCSAADAYGISIVVDVVMNHVANNGNPDQWDAAVDASFKDSSLYHNQGQCTNWNNRYDVTQKGIGMPDLNTQNIAVQNKAITFLNQCVDAGADGFRFDAAKHIETTIGADAGQSWSGNYWNNVLGNLHNKSNIFVYGEILQDGTADNVASYQTFMNVTASNYGGSLRSAITSNNLSQATGMGGLNPAQSVDFVETHDTYEDNSSVGLSALQRKLGWSIIAARSGATPLFFARPTGAIGNSGDSQWKDADVIAVNKFHNAMVGQSEYLRLTNNNNTMLIDRGTIGTTIVNSSTSTYINSNTSLANGTYSNKASQTCTLTVSNGTISGNIPANSVIVLYNTNTALTASANIKGGTYSSAQSVVLTPSATASIYYTTNGSTPTAASTKYTAALNIANSKTLKFKAINSNGVSSPVYTEQYIIDASSFAPRSGYTVDYDSSKLVQGSSFTVYYKGSLASSSSVSMHWGINSWVNPKNVTMTKRSDGFWAGTVTIPTTATMLDFVFTDGNNWDNNGNQDWHLQIAPTNKTTFTPRTGYTVDYDSNTLSKGNSFTIYYKGTLANSSSVSLHWGINSWLTPTNVIMTKRSDGFWEGTVTIPTSATMLDFVFTNGSSWDNNSNQDWHLQIK
jgi:alpha-amylase